MGNDTEYIYGDQNGHIFTDRVKVINFDGTEAVEDPGPVEVRWDPRIQVSHFGHAVQVGIVPPNGDLSSNEAGVWRNQDGQFLHLDRDGCNRLIAAIRAAREAVYGRDE